MASPPRQQITLLLTGKVGYGKSACGNSILGRKAFQADNGSKLCTFMINERSGERDGTLDVRVIDTPGVMELDEKQELINTTIEIPSVMSACPEGIHAICLVLKYDNIFTSEDSQAVSKIKKIFGENFLENHGVIIMTGGDMLEAKAGREEATFQQWCERQKGELQKLIIECGNRVVLFYNRKAQFVKKQKEAVDQLLNMAMEISKNKLYTQDMFKRSRKVEILHLKVPRLSLSMKQNLEELKSDIFQLKHRDIVTERDLNRLKMSNRNILERIIDERKDADIPTQLIDHVEIIHRKLIVFDMKLKVEKQLFQVIKVLDRLLDTPRRRVENTKRSTINVGHSKSASGCDASLKDRSTQSFTDKTMGASATWSSSKVEELKSTRITLVMVGKTGNGKSSTANSILQLDAFKKSDDLTSCTYLTMSASVKRKELEIKVVDSPWYMDPDEKREIDNIDIQIPGIMSVCSEGIHAMLLVFKYGNRFTKEEFDTVCKIKEMFGENILKDHGIIIFTFGENFDMTNEQTEDRGEDPITFETWCRKQDGAIQNLFTECDNRIVLVYNSVLGRFKEKNKEPVKQLMNIAVEMRKKGAYTNEMFEKCKLEREKIIVKYELLELDISFQRKLDFLIQHVNKFKQSNTMTEDDLIQLKRRGKDLLNKVDTISKDTRIKNILKEKVNKILKHLGEINLNQPIAEQMMSLLKLLDTLKNPPIPVETGAAILARLINIVWATSRALGFGSLSFTDRLLHGILSNMNSKPKVKSA